MKILVISDTHGNLPKDLEDIGGDVLFHAGDVGGHSIVNATLLFKNHYIVQGNTDCYSFFNFPDRIRTIVDGVKIFMVHNLTAPHRIINENRLYIDSFIPNLVIYGHTHTPCIRVINDVIYLNPGSFGKIGLTGYMSYAVVNIKDSKIEDISIYDLETGEVKLSWPK